MGGFMVHLTFTILEHSVLRKEHSVVNQKSDNVNKTSLIHHENKTENFPKVLDITLADFLF